MEKVQRFISLIETHHISCLHSPSRYCHPFLIASFRHIKLPPFPNCTCKPSLDIRSSATITSDKIILVDRVITAFHSPFLTDRGTDITRSTCSKEGSLLKSLRAGIQTTTFSFRVWGSYEDNEAKNSVRCTRYPDPTPVHGDISEHRWNCLKNLGSEK